MGFLKAHRDKHKNDYFVSGHTTHLSAGKLHIDDGRSTLLSKYPVAGAHAEVESGATVGGRITATRVGAGFILFGPVGAIIGGIARKDRNKVYLLVTFADGSATSAVFKAKVEPQVRALAAAINQEAGMP